MADDAPRVLVCLVEGESLLFPVTPTGDMHIWDLQKLIKEETKNGVLNGVDSKDLILWKVNLDIPSKKEDRKRLTGKSVPDSVELDNVIEKISNHWPANTTPEKLQIIVELPPVTVPVQPPRAVAQIFDIDVIDQQIEKKFESLREGVEAFLGSPNPRTWVPPNWMTASKREFYEKLQIPTYYNGYPSLLLHGLDSCNVPEIEKFGGPQHMCICNTSGSGKTRRMFEVFTKYWGFYFVAAPDDNGVGVRDLELALRELTGSNGWKTNLSENPREASDQSEINSRIASLPLKRVLAARIVVFKLFLELAIKFDGKLLEKHKHAWLLFQVSYRTLAGHPFVQIMDCLRQASGEALDLLIKRLADIRIEHNFLDFIIGLDEAQRATRLYPRSFVSSTNPKVSRSILREIVKVFTDQSIKLLVSGTGVSMDELRGAVVSGVSKPINVEMYHDLGMFNTWSSLKIFLDRYLPAGFLETQSGHRLQIRMREYLMGRYRFTVSFLELLLRNGLESPHRLLNTYIEKHTMGGPDDPYKHLNSSEPALRVTVNVGNFDWDRLNTDPRAAREAAEIVMSHLTLGETPTYGPVLVNLVEYGIARLRVGNDHEGQIIEPLAFLSLLKWLETQPGLNQEGILRPKLSGKVSRGSAYEEVVILYLLRRMCDKVPFNHIFDFHGTPPSWANGEAQVVGHRSGESVPVDVLGDRPRNPSLGGVQYAKTMDDIIKWIKDPTSTAVLVPTNDFGPDVLVRCANGNGGDVILMGQAKSCLDGNTNSLDAKTMGEALVSLHPDHWFKRLTRPENRLKHQELVDVIRNCRVLRFVAGYPLPPDLNLGAESVHDAITALGPDVVLATISLDRFRRHFIEQGQIGILIPMDSALKQARADKKKADKMKKVDKMKEADKMKTGDEVESADETESADDMENVDKMETGE